MSSRNIHSNHGQEHLADSSEPPAPIAWSNNVDPAAIAQHSSYYTLSLPTAAGASDSQSLNQPDTARATTGGAGEHHASIDHQGLHQGNNISHKQESSLFKQEYKPESNLFAYSRVTQGNASARQHSSSQGMELHDTTGVILQQFAAASDGDVPGVPQSVGQTVAHGVAQGASPLGTQALSQGVAQSVSQPMAQHVQQNGSQGMQQTVQSGGHAQRVQPQSGATGQTVMGGSSQGQSATEPQKKSTRMPGTKQCPTCQGTIAAAVAKCPKCEHVFRAKKEKPKRSGKRGKKNCPKCSFENPSACSSCKNCKHVFRLKLMDRYKQMRPRPNDAVATAAHAALAQPQGAPGAPPQMSSTSVPMPAGVTQYHAQINQPMHPAHSAIPPLSQHPMSMHHVSPHNVHPSTVQAMHPMPQHPMHQHQSHPPL